MIGRWGGNGGLGGGAGRMHTSAAARVDPQPVGIGRVGVGGLAGQ